jgi:hypothetical protein
MFQNWVSFGNDDVWFSSGQGADQVACVQLFYQADSSRIVHLARTPILSPARDSETIHVQQFATPKSNFAEVGFGA